MKVFLTCLTRLTRLLKVRVNLFTTGPVYDLFKYLYIISILLLLTTKYTLVSYTRDIQAVNGE